MQCPMCEHDKSSVKDCRPTEGGSTRRRRFCHNCEHRFTTFEILATEIEATDELIKMAEGLNSLSPRDMQILRATLNAMQQHGEEK